tara:strand:- start:103 stop:678 length:576 start_codon:yes stop_codon:yes gene_type:complete
MNIGEAVNNIKKTYPSVSISRLRFLEKENLIKPKRTKGGTRIYSEKDINTILKILDLQENQFYSLKAIKNNPNLILNSSNKNIKINEYSKHDALKKSGLSSKNFNDLIEFKFEINKDKYSQNDVDRLSAFAFFYNLGLTAKNFSIMKSLADRGLGFFDTMNTANFEINKEDLELSIQYFTLIVGSYILEDL